MWEQQNDTTVIPTKAAAAESEPAQTIPHTPSAHIPLAVSISNEFAPTSDEGIDTDISTPIFSASDSEESGDDRANFTVANETFGRSSSPPQYKAKCNLKAKCNYCLEYFEASRGMIKHLPASDSWNLGVGDGCSGLKTKQRLYPRLLLVVFYFQ